MKKLVPSIAVMAFNHTDGLVPAWKQAMKFAGKKGRIGTMLDVVDARIATGINEHPWNTCYTTLTAEYFGYSRGGNRILIVAHGIGPMSTLAGIQKAYSYEYKDKTRNNRGGRITDQQFRDLESGKYGEVHIIEFDPIVNRYQYPFMEYLTINEALAEPLLRARLGPRAIEYLEHHKAMAQKIHQEDHNMEIGSPYLVEMGVASNCSYAIGGFSDHPLQYPFLDKGNGPVAHLLSTGRLCNASHEREIRVPNSIANDISCHEWSDGVRLVAVRENSIINNIHPGVGSISALILKNWKSLMEKISGPIFPGGFYALMKTDDDTWFTQYSKKGARMDTHEPEFHVTAVEKIGELTEFVTTIGGYYGFFKYATKEVCLIKPSEANAYSKVGDPTIIYTDGNPTHHRVDIQFYHAEVNTSERLIREDVLQNDYGKLMELLAKK